MGNPIDRDTFLARARARFGERYDYSGIQYRSFKSPIKIRCREHPVRQISITPERHLVTTGGCKYCLRQLRGQAAISRGILRGSAGCRRSDVLLHNGRATGLSSGRCGCCRPLAGACLSSAGVAVGVSSICCSTNLGACCWWRSRADPARVWTPGGWRP